MWGGFILNKLSGSQQRWLSCLSRSPLECPKYCNGIFLPGRSMTQSHTKFHPVSRHFVMEMMVLVLHQRHQYISQCIPVHFVHGAIGTEFILPYRYFVRLEQYNEVLLCSCPIQFVEFLYSTSTKLQCHCCVVSC